MKEDKILAKFHGSLVCHIHLSMVNWPECKERTDSVPLKRQLVTLVSCVSGENLEAELCAHMLFLTVA